MSIAETELRPIHESTTDAFREAMRQLASGVSIVTAGRGNEWAGITATSVTSLSLTPPTLLVCVNRASSLVPFLQRYWHFSVSLLSADQQGIADRFAGRGGIDGIDRFKRGRWHTLATGAPVLADALAVVDCKLEEIILRHSHLIAIGRVVGAEIYGTTDSLLYWRGGFARLAASSPRPK